MQKPKFQNRINLLIVLNKFELKFQSLKRLITDFLLVSV